MQKNQRKPKNKNFRNHLMVFFLMVAAPLAMYYGINNQIGVIVYLGLGIMILANLLSIITD